MPMMVMKRAVSVRDLFCDIVGSGGDEFFDAVNYAIHLSVLAQTGSDPQ